MKSQLQKNKEKKYYTNLNSKAIKEIKNKIDNNQDITGYESLIQGPEYEILIKYIQEYKNYKKNKGFEI